MKLYRLLRGVTLFDGALFRINAGRASQRPALCFG
jgi:hypothetical protein